VQTESGERKTTTKEKVNKTRVLTSVIPKKVTNVRGSRDNGTALFFPEVTLYDDVLSLHKTRGDQENEGSEKRGGGNAVACQLDKDSDKK